MSLGEDRVRVKFNPSDVSLVNVIKEETADLINLCDKQAQAIAGDTARRGEMQRLWSLAMTAYEEAAMWAVKAATAKN